MGFYDSKGYWRNDGDGFYDSKGYFRSPGDGFYDSKGYFRSAGDGFYDAKGNWVNPGDAFYDGKGYIRSGSAIYAATTNTGEGVVATIGTVLFIPVALLWGMTVLLVEWIAAHMYLIFIGYAALDILLCYMILKNRRYREGVQKALGFAGNYICFLSLIYMTIIYAVPYVMINNGSLGSFFDFTFTLVLVACGIAVIQSFNYYHEKAVLEFLLGVGFFIIIIVLLRNETAEMISIESLAEIYQTKASALFKILFGFAVAK